MTGQYYENLKELPIPKEFKKGFIQAIIALEKPLTQAEAAVFLGYDLKTVQSKVSRGELPAHKLPGGQVYLYASELNALIRGTFTNRGE